MPLKVLVVDDANFVRDMIKRTVRLLVPDVELYEATDGAKAISVLKSKGADLILSDWEMPEMSGEELLRWVRTQPNHGTTPFVMITSRGDRNHVLAAAQAGVSDYLSKPFSTDELSRKITKQLKRIGYEFRNASTANRGIAYSSVDVLTGGRSAITTQSPAADVSPSVTALTTKRQPTPPSASPSTSNKNPAFKGSVHLRFPHTTCEYHLLETSQQALCGTVNRPPILPTVFDQAVVDILSESGEALARVNAYIHSVSACEVTPDSERVRLIVRFVDDDPAKRSMLAELFGNG